MAEFPSDRRGLLTTEGSGLSDFSDASTAIASPTKRHGFHRMDSGSAEYPIQPSQPSSNSSKTNFESNVDDLGISGSRRSINRVPVGSRMSQTPPTSSKPFSPLSTLSMTPPTPTSSKGFLSPTSPTPWTRSHAGGGMYMGGLDPMEEMEEQDLGKGKATFNDSVDDIYEGRQVRSVNTGEYDDRRRLVDGCSSARDIHSSRRSWLSISILILSIYSTLFSGIWLMLAIVQPRYGRRIHSGGTLSPSTASTLFAMFAKTIELSFVTVFVTFLGQAISRRSLVKASRGVTITELTMRTWVIQPGFIITHFRNLQHAGLSVLGMITLTAAVVATFYTTASDTLVSPHLKYSKWEHRLMQGVVESSYGNVKYIENKCETPITTEIDSAYSASTCLSIEHAGQGYHNFLAFLENWATIQKAGQGASPWLYERPPPVATLYDNTTVTGQWITNNQYSINETHAKTGRIVNHVMMSMPHAGVPAAAHDPINGILQPEDLGSLGRYSVLASVASPSVNVTCVDMTLNETQSLINTTTPTGIPGVDGIFGWGAGHGIPTFPHLPVDYNSLHNVNVTGSDSIYLLVKAPFNVAPPANYTNYTLCEMRSFVSPNCSTEYNVSGTNQASLSSNCDDPDDRMAFWRSLNNASTPVTLSKDWRELASTWSSALSLNDGISDAHSSTARLLSQLIITAPTWNGTYVLPPLRPSLAEGLAVLVGNTLLLSTLGSTFQLYWDYQSNILGGDPKYLPFNASVAAQQYTSGQLQPWQGIFYPVLIIVFLANVCCLVYFFIRSGLVTDFTEPQNLFAIAINSPPSERLGGSCGAGPATHQLTVPFYVKERENHFFMQEGGVDEEGGEMEMRRRRVRERRSVASISSYGKLSNKRKSFL